MGRVLVWALPTTQGEATMSMLSGVEARKLVTLEMGSVLLPEGKREALRLFREYTGHGTPTWFSWESQAEQDDPFLTVSYTDKKGNEITRPVVYRGKLVNRLANLAKQKHGVKLTGEQKQKLGVVISENWLVGTFTFDFTQDLDWFAGDFGDRGSCFWGQYSDALRALDNDPDGWAVRFYEDGKGIGRAWIMDHGDKLCLVNGYFNPRQGGSYNGNYAQSHTALIAQVVACFLNVSYQRVDVHADSDFFINSDTGFLIGKNLNGFHTFDWGLEVSGGSTCEHCNERAHEDEMYYVEAAGGSVCEYCLSDNYSFCEHCEEHVSNDDIHSVEETVVYNGREYTETTGLCDYCYQDKYCSCYNCQADVAKDSVHLGADDNDYCETCHGDLFDYCEGCDSTVDHDEMKESPDGERLCDDCFTSRYMTCDCGEVHEKEVAPYKPATISVQSSTTLESAVALVSRTTQPYSMSSQEILVYEDIGWTNGYYAIVGSAPGSAKDTVDLAQSSWGSLVRDYLTTTTDEPVFPSRFVFSPDGEASVKIGTKYFDARYILLVLQHLPAGHLHLGLSARGSVLIFVVGDKPVAALMGQMHTDDSHGMKWGVSLD